jgi:hypothetical protein
MYRQLWSWPIRCCSSSKEQLRQAVKSEYVKATGPSWLYWPAKNCTVSRHRAGANVVEGVVVPTAAPMLNHETPSR